jgi:hypothetical protein
MSTVGIRVLRDRPGNEGLQHLGTMQARTFRDDNAGWQLGAIAPRKWCLASHLTLLPMDGMEMEPVESWSTDGKRTRRFQRRAADIALLAWLLAGPACTLGPDPQELVETIDRLTDEGGYRSPRMHAVTEVRDTWKHDGVSLEVSYLWPDGANEAPLILYQPGLGESAGAGAFWRRSWAEAGYAVLSVQVASIGAGFDLNAPLGSGEMRALGRKHFASASLERRLGHVCWAVAELRRRAVRRDTLYASADTERITVAGFEIGAQSAFALAGEQNKTFSRPDCSFEPQAAIILSPYVAVADGSSEQRFQAVSRPVLVVTGSEDDDPFGLTPASLRAEPWRLLPADEKYLFSLTGMTHFLLSGAEPGDLNRNSPGSDGPDGDRGRFSAPPGNHFGPVSAAGGGPQAGAGVPPQRGPGMMDEDRFQGAASIARMMAVVRSVSLAFLDSVNRDSGAARTWLSGEAVRWIGRGGTLKRK